MGTADSDLRPKDLPAVQLDELDRRIVRILSGDARITNADLAAALDIAPSTAHARTRSLIDRGVIRGFHACVDHQRLGRGLLAM
ncbi:MAG: Lrp/AsnC family transcriptional regulator, partial [Microbacterium sp.]